MQVIYTDRIETLKALQLKYQLQAISFEANHLKSVFLIVDSNYDVKSLMNKGLVITLFSSDYSDLELEPSTKEMLEEQIDFFLELMSKEHFKELPKEEKEDQQVAFQTSDENPVTVRTEESFQGIYVKNILIKQGNIRFLPLFDTILAIYKQKFSGFLEVKKRQQTIFELYFQEGELTYIHCFLEEGHFQAFLKQHGYVSKMNEDIALFPVEQQLDIYIESNSVFKRERDVLYKDYMSFLFRKLVSLTHGDFLLHDKSHNHKHKIFTSYLNFLYNFIAYFKHILSYPERVITTEEQSYLSLPLNEEIQRFLKDARYGNHLKKIASFYPELGETYVLNAYYFLLMIGLVEEEQKDEKVQVSSSVVHENIAQRIALWLDKIKKENYFNLLGVNIQDNDFFIEEKFRELFSQFSHYLSSEEIRVKHRQDLEDILFELESAYEVMKERSLREAYYKGMLK